MEGNFCRCRACMARLRMSLRQLRTPSPGRGVTMYVEKHAAAGLLSVARTQENFTTTRGRDTAFPAAWLLSLTPLGARPELLSLQRNPSEATTQFVSMYL